MTVSEYRDEYKINIMHCIHTSQSISYAFVDQIRD